MYCQKTDAITDPSHRGSKGVRSGKRFLVARSMLDLGVVGLQSSQCHFGRVGKTSVDFIAGNQTRLTRRKVKR
jgi:hypothetical protein